MATMTPSLSVYLLRPVPDNTAFEPKANDLALVTIFG
jgi:hypothetical protein